MYFQLNNDNQRSKMTPLTNFSKLSWNKISQKTWTGTVVDVSLRILPWHLVKNSQIGQFQMLITQQPLNQISCCFFHSTANRYRINKLLIKCPILIQNMSKNDAKHNQFSYTWCYFSLLNAETNGTF